MHKAECGKQIGHFAGEHFPPYFHFPKIYQNVNAYWIGFDIFSTVEPVTTQLKGRTMEEATHDSQKNIYLTQQNKHNQKYVSQ